VLRKQPAEWWSSVPARLAEAATAKGIVMYDGAKCERQPVSIHLTPWLLTEAQCRYLQLVGTRMRRVVNRLLRSYFQDEALQAVLPLGDSEREWLRAVIPNGFPEPATVFERFDTNLLIDDPHWDSALQVLELNAVGIGCLHFQPAANALIEEHVLPVLRGVIPSATCRSPEDPRVLLRKLLEWHARAIGRKNAVTAFVERREDCLGGADEMHEVARFLQAQGLPTVYADPRELELRDGEIVYKDTVVDLIYRDFMLKEIVSIERHGGKVDAIKHAFQRNQVISSLTGEFDHKSMLECLSNPEFGKYFTPSQRRTFQAFVPWTRLIYGRSTIDPSGRQVDLIDYIREHRESLVMKPNRAYGGQDVVIGAGVTQAVWEAAIAKAMDKASTCVVQEFVRLPQVEFIATTNGRHPVSEFVTVGFTATPHGIEFLGRSSGNRIVNITRGGNLVPVFIVK
jgi:hypothetical protein